MRKIIVIEHISQDGVIQGPGGKTEDPSNGFDQGGWIFQYSDEILSIEIRRIMKSSFDLLLGRITYQIWADYWPYNDGWQEANQAIKYVASNTMKHANWAHSFILSGNIVDQIKEIKNQDGKDIHIWGSSNLLKTLFKHDLIDELWLIVYPITLGHGKRLFEDESMILKFTKIESLMNTKGVVVSRHIRF